MKIVKLLLIVGDSITYVI